jgi:hypothetical protein
MLRKMVLLLAVFFVVGAYVSAQNLVVDYQYNVAAADAKGNYLTFSGIPKAEVKKDAFDAGSGASKQKATALFASYEKDSAGKTSFPSGVRGLLLFPLANPSFRTDTGLNVVKAASGVITIQYVYRGIAYRIVTDATGKVTFPKAKDGYSLRVVGYADGAKQVISQDFSADGTVAKIDWAKVWDAKVAAGKAIPGNVNAKTGAVIADLENSTLLTWSGPLTFAFDGKILKVTGSLKEVKGK